MEFQTLAEETDWNEPALTSAFQWGFNRSVRDTLVSVVAANFLVVVDCAIEINNYKKERRREHIFSRSLHSNLRCIRTGSRPGGIRGGANAGSGSTVFQSQTEMSLRIGGLLALQS